MKHTLCDWFGWFCREGSYVPPTAHDVPEISATPLFLACIVLVIFMALLYDRGPTSHV